jgi:hypothetical protein
MRMFVRTVAAGFNLVSPETETETDHPELSSGALRARRRARFAERARAADFKVASAPAKLAAGARQAKDAPELSRCALALRRVTAAWAPARQARSAVRRARRDRSPPRCWRRTSGGCMWCWGRVGGQRGCGRRRGRGVAGQLPARELPSPGWARLARRARATAATTAQAPRRWLEAAGRARLATARCAAATTLALHPGRARLARGAAHARARRAAPARGAPLEAPPRARSAHAGARGPAPAAHQRRLARGTREAAARPRARLEAAAPAGAAVGAAAAAAADAAAAVPHGSGRCCPSGRRVVPRATDHRVELAEAAATFHHLAHRRAAAAEGGRRHGEAGGRAPQAPRLAARRLETADRARVAGDGHHALHLAHDELRPTAALVVPARGAGAAPCSVVVSFRHPARRAELARHNAGTGCEAALGAGEAAAEPGHVGERAELPRRTRDAGAVGDARDRRALARPAVAQRLRQTEGAPRRRLAVAVGARRTRRLPPVAGEVPGRTRRAARPAEQGRAVPAARAQPAARAASARTVLALWAKGAGPVGGGGVRASRTAALRCTNPADQKRQPQAQHAGALPEGSGADAVRASDLIRREREFAQL